MMSLNKINFKQILGQLKADLIGKDAHRGVTLTYSWLANQFGHISLGFIPVILFQPSVCSWLNTANGVFYTALIVSTFWFLFESYNLLAPLLVKKKSSSNKNAFSPQWSNLIFDTFTDLLFFWVGAFSASLFLMHSTLNLLIVIVLLVLLVYPLCFWFLTKMYQFYASYPFQFRLSQWGHSITKEDKRTVDEYLNSEIQGRHLLIYGTSNSGKTSLSIGVANELSIKHRFCTYLTAMKLYPLLITDKSVTKPNPLWEWHEAEFLVIDDITTETSNKEEVVTANQFFKIIDGSKQKNEQGSSILSDKNIIWVLGQRNTDLIANDCSWEVMLKDIGVDEANISVVHLS